MTSSSDPLELLDELALGPGQGRRGRPVALEVVRSLTPDDIPALESRSSPATVTGLSPTLALRSAHHEIARQLVAGQDLELVALITGYSPTYISTLKRNPAFAELLTYYQTERELVFVDALKRMEGLGLGALEELQARLAEAPEGFAKRELMELVELTLVKGRGVGGGRGTPDSAGPGVSINVKFVQADTPGGLTIDVGRAGGE